MIVTTTITELPVLCDFTESELKKAFELAEEFNATGIVISKCGTIEFDFDREEDDVEIEDSRTTSGFRIEDPYFGPEHTYVRTHGAPPDPFIPTVCELTCETDGAASD